MSFCELPVVFSAPPALYDIMGWVPRRELDLCFSAVMQEDIYMNLPYLWREIARKDDDGEWKSCVYSDVRVGKEFYLTFSSYLLKFLERTPSCEFLRIEGSSFSIRLENKDSSVFVSLEERERLVADAYSDDNDYFELEFTFHHPVSGDVFYLLAAVKDTSFHDSLSLVDFYGSESFWCNGELLVNMREDWLGHANTISWSYEDEAVGFSLYFPFGSLSEENNGVCCAFFPITEKEGAPSLFDMLIEVNIVGIGTEDVSYLPSSTDVKEE